ncbi:MAG: hypothetical protein AABN33_00280 [Acidobacteriota bacterium]
MNPLQEKSTVIVIFAGLMFFHNYEQGRFLKVGILRGAPDHVLSIDGPITQRLLKQRKYKKNSRRAAVSLLAEEMVLEITNPQIGTVSEATPLETVPGPFDIKNPAGNKTDYRYVVDFDRLYGTGYNFLEGALSPNIDLRAGIWRTLCRTEFLTYRRGGAAPEDFGFMADIMASDIELKEKESLALRDQRDGRIILEAKYMPGTTQYIVIANVPPRELRHHHDGLPTHFQNYYLAVPMPYNERVEFGLKNPGPSPCLDLPKQRALVQVLNEFVKSPPPYFCGIGSTSKDWVVRKR